eukprot:scaffold81055_cov21-Tisochrysis_lutea.AAC.1
MVASSYSALAAPSSAAPFSAAVQHSCCLACLKMIKAVKARRRLRQADAYMLIQGAYGAQK